MMAKSKLLPLSFIDSPAGSRTKWFSEIGCVVHHEQHSDVVVGGYQIGRYHRELEPGWRNLLMVQLSQGPRVHLGRLSAAFEVSEETLRKKRRFAEHHGPEALVPAGELALPVVRGELREQLHGLFAEGLGTREAHRRLGKKPPVSVTTVWRELKSWERTRSSGSPGVVAAEAKGARRGQTKLLDVAFGSKIEEAAVTADLAASSPDVVEAAASSNDAPSAAPSHPEDHRFNLGSAAPQSHRLVQHVGAWLFVAMVSRHGLYEAIAQLWEKRRGGRSLRVALDALVIALALGQRCVEGVRRLATPSSGRLLRADQAPSASWVRRVFKRFAEQVGCVRLHLMMSGVYMRRAQADSGAVTVFYVDNHMRPYTGKYTVRKGWRMQDKRVRKGVSDYYVHDEDGRPVMRVDVPEHGHLTDWLSPLAQSLRLGLGKKERILLAFDRGGAFVNQLVELRNAQFEFVTYERRPYPLLNPGAFTHEVTMGDETIGVHESRTNLGNGRGRLRRIALRKQDGYQVNLLAHSDEPVERLIAVITGRWIQENGFKHGNERWGINQLDGRKTEHYSPETIIPNPARRRLDRTLRVARVQEGLARRELARRADDDPKRPRFQRKLADAMAEQEKMEALRPSTPDKAPLQDTELAGKLVFHKTPYKGVLDTVRIACINAEADLACELACHLRRPQEAKMALANLLAAPGRVTVGKKRITVTLQPSGNADEQRAYSEFLRQVNQWELHLPGDNKCRPLSFRTQQG